jgi:Tfp pilus assembly protein PilF
MPPKTPLPASQGASPLALDQASAKTRSTRNAAGLAHIDAQQQQRARAAAVMKAAGGPAANVVALLRANPVMMIGAVAVLFGIGFGAYVYLQIAHPGIFVSTPAAQPVPSPQTTPAPPAAKSVETAAPVASPAAATASPEPPAPASAPAKPASSGTIAAPAKTSSAPTPLPAASVISSTATQETDKAPAQERGAGSDQRSARGSLRENVPAGPAASSRQPAVADAGPPARERIAVSATNAQPRLNPVLTQAYGLLQSGNTTEAHALYTKLLQAEPLNIDALLGLAYIAGQERRTDEATKLYLRILELNPRHTLAQAGLIGLMGRADPAASESRLKQLIAREPSAFLHFVLGNLYAEQSQWAQAQQSYFQAHHLEPSNPDYAYNLAVGLDHLRQAKLALNYYRRAEQLASAQGRANFDVTHARERIRVLSSGLE